MALTETIEVDGKEIIKNKVDTALRRITETYYAFAGSGRLGSDLPAWVAFSGGKDSVVLLDLVRRSGIPFEAHYSVTSVDPPELVQFIKSIPDVIMDIPRYRDGTPITMWNLIVKQGMPPNRNVRYCCTALKESAGSGRLTLTGVRWAESVRRKKSWGVVNLSGKRKLKKANELGIEVVPTGKDKGAFDPLNYVTGNLEEDIDDYTEDPNESTVMLNNDNNKLRSMMEYCMGRGKTTLNPIIDWEDEDVWEYIETEHLPYCCLYSHGGGGMFSRLGCIGCPLQSLKSRHEDFEIYPSYRNAYLRTFDRMLKARRDRDLSTGRWYDAQDVMDWWLSPPPNKEGYWQGKQK